MKLRTRLLLLLVGPVMYTLACSSPNEPAEQGSIVFRFDRGQAMTALAAAGGVSDVFDSVAVCVFRAGSPLAEEVRSGAAITVDPVELTLGCIAEANKRVSVELFAGGVMYYHGVNEDVDVVAGTRTDVMVDAYPFFVPSLSVTPGIVSEGGTFDLSWPSTAGAGSYRVESSATADFASLEWEQSLAETLTTATLPPGAHYFRVAPQTPYATGSFAGPEITYVVGGSGAVLITGFSAPAVIPGELVTVYGENLDFPGTQAAVGTTFMQVVSASWGALTVRMPVDGKTGYVAVGSSLGSDLSDDALVALRIAYVTAGREYAQSFTDLLWSYGADLEWSAVATIPIEALDTRDMSVFDVIVVANDTGTDIANWGGGILSRATAITASGADVLAMGDGGLAFLALTLPEFRAAVFVGSASTCYAPQPNVPVFQNPYSVIGTLLPGNVSICAGAERQISLNNPSGTNNYGSTGALSNRWVLLDAQVLSQRYFYWGFAADPKGFSTDGQHVLVNVMVLLYR
jgi:hypothetical protein